MNTIKTSTIEQINCEHIRKIKLELLADLENALTLEEVKSVVERLIEEVF